jgi:tetratricopeptide (TPR) repeat protein
MRSRLPRTVIHLALIAGLLPGMMAAEAPRDDRAGNGPAPATVIAEAAQAEARRWVDAGRSHWDAGDHARALACHERALALLPATTSDAQAADLRARVERALAALRARLVADDLGRQDDGRHEALVRATRERARRASTAEASLRERIRRIELDEAKDLVEVALADARRLVQDFPGVGEPAAILARLMARSHARRDLSIDEQRSELVQEAQERMQRSLIPTSDVLADLYPADWGSRHPEGSQPLVPTDDEDHPGFREVMSQRVDIDLADQDGMAFLRELAGRHHLNLAIAPEVPAERPITLRAYGITLRHAITWMGTLMDIRPEFRRGMVFLGPSAPEAPIIAIYDIAEATFPVQDQVPKWQLGLPTQPGAVAGTTLLASTPTEPTAVAPEDLVDLLMGAVTPVVWQRPDCSIVIRDKTLLVTAPASSHALISQFLHSYLTRSRLIIGVDARWVLLTDAFLEEIGVQWSTNGSLLDLPGASTAGFRRTTSQFDHRGELINAVPSSLVAPNPATVGTGLTLSSVLLSATQLSATMHAIERTRTMNAVQGCSLHTFNGVRAYALFGLPLTYLGGFEVDSTTGNGLTPGVSPTISVIMLGTQLDVTPYASADRKYVTMEFGSTLATLESLGSESVASVRSLPVGFDPALNNGQGGPIVANTTTSNRVELPNIRKTELRTNVMIPDGGTALIGGFAKDVEQSMSAKIPFLGHIPFIGRLFGERRRNSDRLKIQLLVTVDIIDYEERERWQ